MGRKPQFDKSTFTKAYKANKSISQIALSLNTSTITVRKYLKLYQLKIVPSARSTEISKIAEKVFKSYSGVRTIRSIASQFGLPLRQVRYYIHKQSMVWYRAEEPKWPFPDQLCQIKIVKALVTADNANWLWDHPEVLTDLTGLPRRIVDDYQTHAFNTMWEKSHSNEKGNSRGPKKRSK